MARTLQNYIDEIRLDAKDERIPQPYLKRKINKARRKISRITRCLECRTNCSSVVDQYNYRIPRSSNDSTFVDLVEAKEVKYDGKLLDWKNPNEMVWLLDYSNSGTPIYYSYFGGQGQLTGQIYVYPAPSVALKILQIWGIQYALPLINRNDTCGLNDELQDLAIDYVVAELFVLKWHPAGPYMMKLVMADIRSNINLKTL